MIPADDEVVASVVETLTSGKLRRYDGPDSPVSRFEEAFCRLVGGRHGVGVNSGSSGMLVALLACGIRPGDEVLVPAFTFIAVPSAVISARGTPTLVEITDDLVLDCDDLEAKITPRTKFLLLSYMRGRVPDLDRVLAICRDRSITIVEDAAYSVGVLWDGMPTGRFGLASSFAFHTVLDSGEGGLVMTDDDEVAAKAMFIAGCYDDNWRKHPGVNGREDMLASMVNSLPFLGVRMANVVGAHLLPQLPLIEARIERFADNYAYVAARLEQLPEVRIVATHPKVRPVSWSVQFELSGLERDELQQFVTLANLRGVDLRIAGLEPTNSRCYWNWRFFEPNDCPRTRALLERSVDFSLPLWLERPGLDYIADVIQDTLWRLGRRRSGLGARPSAESEAQ